MYHRLADGLNSIGKLIPENANVYDFINKDKDYYLSIYKYNEEHKKIAEEIIDAERVDKKTKEVIKYKRARGIEGIEDVVTDIIGFDFDDKQNLDNAKEDTITVIGRLLDLNIDVEDINVSFSGNKGFSVVIKHDKELTPTQHRFIAESIAGDLKTFDTTLYNASRIFRVDGTKHNSTGLYKAQIDPDELLEMSAEDIKAKAKNKTVLKQFKKITLPESIFNLKPKEKVVEKTKEEQKHIIDFSKKPYYLTDLKYALHKGFIPPSDGNEGMMILCSTYKHVGFDMVDAYHMLKGVNEKRAEIYNIPKRDNNSIWKEVVEVIYNPSWKGGTYSVENSKLLQETAKKFGVTENSKLESFDSIKESFFQFADNINENVIKTGIKSLDETLLITTGMMVGVLGAPSAGKTSLVTAILEKSAMDGMKPLFHSLDMTKHLMMMRLIQRQSGVNTQDRLRRKIEGDPNYDKDYTLREDSAILEAVEKLGKIYRNVEFNFTRGTTIESLEEDIKMNKAKNGDKFKLVVVDYLEKVRGPYSDATANSGFVASRMSDLASTYDVCIILLLQPQKSAGDPSEELLSMRKVKGASVIEQDCRVILTMWRPGFDPRDGSRDKYASIAIVKNNMGEVKTLDYRWDGLKGNLNELTKLEREALNSLREDLKNKKAEENSNGWDI
jgi:replicative DNA helicase